MKTEVWEKVGQVGVDAGLLWVGDPCYIIHSDSLSDDLGKNWSEFCQKLDKIPDGVRQWGHSTGMTVGTGWGDGSYDVLVQRNKEGRVMRVMVDFDYSEGEFDNEGFGDEEDYCLGCGEYFEYCDCYLGEEEGDCS